MDPSTQLLTCLVNICWISGKIMFLYFHITLLVSFLALITFWFIWGNIYIFCLPSPGCNAARETVGERSYMKSLQSLTHGNKNTFVQSAIIFLSSSFMPVIILGNKDLKATKMDKNSCFHGSYFLVRGNTPLILTKFNISWKWSPVKNFFFSFYFPRTFTST